MKKILCLVMAAVLAVVMMEPMRASAQYPIEVDVRNGVAQITGSSYPASDENGAYTGGSVSYSVVLPVTTKISGLNENSFYDGFYSFSASLNMTINVPVTTEYRVQVKDITCSYDEFKVHYLYSDGNYATGTVSSNQVLSNICPVVLYPQIHDSLIADGSDMYVIYYIEYVITLRSSANSSNAYGTVSNVTGNAAYTGYGVFLNETDVPVGSNWLNNKLNSIHSLVLTGFNTVATRIATWGENIVSSVTTLQMNIGNWFQTQWTFGRQWTDDIVDAVVGQGGGSMINSAQDKLDQQLNDFGTAEDQIADQVVDKVEIPSLVLNDSQASSLTWVIGMMNTWYLKFDELQVIFSSILFFGIIGVILFGRRSL